MSRFKAHQTSSKLAQLGLSAIRYGGVYTGAGSVEWLHVEDINTVHLSENLETLKSGGLLDIGWDRSDWGSRWHEVGLALDLCSTVSAAPLKRQLSVKERFNGA